MAMVVNSIMSATLNALNQHTIRQDTKDKNDANEGTFVKWIKMMDKYLQKNSQKNSSYICVAGDQGNQTNPKVKSLIETVFPLCEIYIPYPGVLIMSAVYSRKSIPYKMGNSPFKSCPGSVADCIDLMSQKNVPFFYWRDDITLPTDINEKFFKVTVNKVSTRDINTRGRCIFWNLFLLALDDKIYDKKMSDVMSLAQKLGFTESMMRDWCHAVEYVFAGNMLSENCDLQCDTPEGKVFFLHDERIYDDVGGKRFWRVSLAPIRG